MTKRIAYNIFLEMGEQKETIFHFRQKALGIFIGTKNIFSSYYVSFT